MSLIDAGRFRISTALRGAGQAHVIRREAARDRREEAAFKPADTAVAVSWENAPQPAGSLRGGDRIRAGRLQPGVRDKRARWLSDDLMQRWWSPARGAIRSTLEKRLGCWARRAAALFAIASEEEWTDLDGQEQVDITPQARLKALKNERAEVKLLLEAATRCEQAGPDAKAEALLDWLYRLQSEEGDAELKALVFTEFVPTQEMLRRFLTERGFAVVCLNGSMDMEERKRVQEAFAKDARILISTDAGGEGLNLQFCHVVVNYDIREPDALEQRIGKWTGSGSRTSSGQFRVRVRWSTGSARCWKVAVFSRSSASTRRRRARLGLSGPCSADVCRAIWSRGGESVESGRRRSRRGADEHSVLGDRGLDPGGPTAAEPPLPRSSMTVSYLKALGARRREAAAALTWPDGETYERGLPARKRKVSGRAT